MDSTSLRSSGSHAGSARSAQLGRDGGRPGGPGGGPLALLYGPIADSLAKVESRIRREMRSRDREVSPLLQHGSGLGGKRLRPAMLMLAGAAVGELNEDHVVLGTVVEMVHTATLVHDDVLDGARTRRHVPTVNARWSSEASILVGDYLFAQSFRLAATLESTEACRWIGEAARKVCEGELKQLLLRDVLAVDEATYVDTLRGKTGELCRVACMLGARSSGGEPDRVAALGRYGEAAGIAFQIADDYLDLWGDDRTVGKTLGTDLRQGKLTLPVIRLLETSSAQRRASIVRALEGPPEQRWPAIRDALENSDAADYTYDRAAEYRDRAVDALAGLPPSESKDALQRVAAFAVSRQF